MNLQRQHFLDTNVLVYSFGAANEEKRERATEVIRYLRDSGSAMVSCQVLGETFVTLRRLAASHAEATFAVDQIADAYPVADISRESVLHAVRLTAQFSVSYYDALVIATARAHGASFLLTEDLQAEQVIEGIRVLHVLDPAFDLSRLA